MKKHLPQQLLGLLIGSLFRIYSSLFKFRFIKGEYKTLEDHLIYAFWHQDILALFPLYHSARMVAMISPSKDGMMLQKGIELFGLEILPASSHKNSVQGVKLALRAISKNKQMAIAVDGPRGPRFEPKEGILFLSKATKKPIVPVVIKQENVFQVKKSWDQMKIFKPFKPIEVFVGEPQFFEHVQDLKEAMLGLTKDAH